MGPLFSHAKWTCELAIKWTQRQKSTGKSPHFSGSTVHGPRPHFIDTPCCANRKKAFHRQIVGTNWRLSFDYILIIPVCFQHYEYGSHIDGRNIPRLLILSTKWCKVTSFRTKFSASVRLSFKSSAATIGSMLLIVVKCFTPFYIKSDTVTHCFW